VLLADDYGHMRVEGITPDGVTWLPFPGRQHRTWAELTRLKCEIIAQPTEESGDDTLHWRLGPIRIDHSGVLEPIMRRDQVSETTVDDLERALAIELVRLAPAASHRLELTAWMPDEAEGPSQDSPLVSIASEAGVAVDATPLVAPVKALRDRMREFPNRTWSRLSLAVWREGERWRFGASVEYR